MRGAGAGMAPPRGGLNCRSICVSEGKTQPITRVTCEVAACQNSFINSMIIVHRAPLANLGLKRQLRWKGTPLFEAAAPGLKMPTSLAPCPRPLSEAIPVCTSTAGAASPPAPGTLSAVSAALQCLANTCSDPGAGLPLPPSCHHAAAAGSQALLLGGCVDLARVWQRAACGEGLKDQE